MHTNETVTLKRDCEAVQIPSGNRSTYLYNAAGWVTQQVDYDRHMGKTGPKIDGKWNTPKPKPRRLSVKARSKLPS